MPFSKMADTSETRMKFIKHAIDYLRQYKLDGLDLDWEYPACRGSPLTDKTKFTALVTVGILKKPDLETPLFNTYSPPPPPPPLQ